MRIKSADPTVTPVRVSKHKQIQSLKPSEIDLRFEASRFSKDKVAQEISKLSLSTQNN